MSDDAAAKVEKLLKLAAGSANENEARNAALSAARLFQSEKLAITASVQRPGTSCIMCQPATRLGQCFRCGHVGAGPGHACTKVELETLCAVHRTWIELARTIPKAPPPVQRPYVGGYGYVSSLGFGGSSYRDSYGFPRPFADPFTMPVPEPAVSTEIEIVALKSELARERMRSEAFEKDVARLEDELQQVRAARAEQVEKEPMPTGVPYTLKCPKCKRGKWGKQPIDRGVERTEQTRERWCGRYLRRQRFVRCRDCGHAWWTTLDNEVLRSKEFRERAGGSERGVER